MPLPQENSQLYLEEPICAGRPKNEAHHESPFHWILSLIYPVLIEFNKSIIKYPNIKRFPGGASNDLLPNLQNPANPVPAMDPKKPPRIGAGGG